MSVARIRKLLSEQPLDERITLEEVLALIDAAIDEGEVTAGEQLVLRAALEAHRERFDPDAYAALEAFLAGKGRGG